MFEVGWSEYILIFGLALVVLGPEKLPKLAASIGRWVGRARVMARQFRDQLETETESIRSSVNDVKQGFESSVQEPPPAPAAHETAAAEPAPAEEAAPHTAQDPIPEYLQDPAPLPLPPDSPAANPPGEEQDERRH